MIRNTLSNVRISDEGRITMPLMWNQRVSHLLGKNLNLSKAILTSNHKKLKRSPEKIRMVDDVIKEQLAMGIIERVPNLQNFLENHPSLAS